MRLNCLLVLAALAGPWCAPRGQVTVEWQAKPAQVDVAVINAAMISFFEKTAWRTSDWAKGDFIVVWPQWATKSRPSFESFLDSAIVSAFYQTKGEADLRKLEALKSSIRREGDAFDPGELQQLRELQFDERIVVSYDKRSAIESLDEVKVKNRVGKEGTIRVGGHVSPPAYSYDGRYAIVRMSGIPWSIHSAELTFFLELTSKGWKVVHVKSVYFV